MRCSYCILYLSLRSLRIYYAPPRPPPLETEGEGGHIAFGADPVGIGVRVASCLHSTFLTKGWILTKLILTHYLLEWGQEVIRFW